MSKEHPYDACPACERKHDHMACPGCLSRRMLLVAAMNGKKVTEEDWKRAERK
jgi:hypothetical protein